MDEFERLLEAERVSVERFVRFRMRSKTDADDVLQEIFLTAYQKFPQLKNKDSFKAFQICNYILRMLAIIYIYNFVITLMQIRTADYVFLLQ